MNGMGIKLIGISALLALWFAYVYTAMIPQIQEHQNLHADESMYSKQHGLNSGMAVYKAMEKDPAVRKHIEEFLQKHHALVERMENKWWREESTRPLALFIIHLGSLVGTFHRPEKIGGSQLFWPSAVWVLATFLSGLIVLFRKHKCTRSKE